jgi:uncharacterized protein
MLAVRQVMTVTQPESIQVENLRDPKDAIIIAAAIAGAAEFIISGDQDLLVLGDVFGIKIRSPRDFIAQAN